MGHIVLRLDRVMADRKMSLNELSEKVGVANVNLFQDEKRAYQRDTLFNPRGDLRGVSVPTWETFWNTARRRTQTEALTGPC